MIIILKLEVESCAFKIMQIKAIESNSFQLTKSRQNQLNIFHGFFIENYFE